MLGFGCFCVLFHIRVFCNILFHYYVYVCILPGKVISEMISTVSGGMLKPTHSFTHSLTSMIKPYTFCIHCRPNILSSNAVMYTAGVHDNTALTRSTSSGNVHVLAVGDLSSGHAFNNGCTCQPIDHPLAGGRHVVECHCGAPRLRAQLEFVSALMNISKRLSQLPTKDMRSESTSTILCHQRCVFSSYSVLCEQAVCCDPFIVTCREEVHPSTGLCAACRYGFYSVVLSMKFFWFLIHIQALIQLIVSCTGAVARCLRHLNCAGLTG